MLPIDNSTASKYVKDNFLDANSLNGVKAMGRDHDPQALKEIAKKFEAIFVQEMLKNMRAANEVFAEDSYFNSSETQFHQDMLDQQMSLEMTNGRGLGLADALYAQMQAAYGHEKHPASPPAKGDAAFTLDQVSQQQPVKDLAQSFYRQQLLAVFNEQNTVSSEAGQRSADTSLLTAIQAANVKDRVPAAERVAVASGGKASIAGSPAEFIAALTPHAQKAAATLNVKADVLLAQAALETGWGQHVIHNQRGENSFNLFNIKADARWGGERVNVATLEYHQGVARQERADFRRYGNYAESFADYVNFLQANPRYQQALALGPDSSAYADALQEAGYATDPAYAEKIKNLLGSEVIRAGVDTLVNPASTMPNET